MARNKLNELRNLSEDELSRRIAAQEGRLQELYNARKGKLLPGHCGWCAGCGREKVDALKTAVCDSCPPELKKQLYQLKEDMAHAWMASFNAAKSDPSGSN